MGVTSKIHGSSGCRIVGRGTANSFAESVPTSNFPVHTLKPGMGWASRLGFVKGIEARPVKEPEE